jgi:phosphoketolase
VAIGPICGMTILNNLDHFHPMMDTIDHLAKTGDKGIILKQQLTNS